MPSNEGGGLPLLCDGFAARMTGLYPVCWVYRFMQRLFGMFSDKAGREVASIILRLGWRRFSLIRDGIAGLITQRR